MAGVALGDVDVHSAWQAWHLWHWLVAAAATTAPPFAWPWHFATLIFTLRGRRGTWRHGRAFCVAGMALMALGWFRWRAWVGFGAHGRRRRLRGSRGTSRHRSSLCVAGMAVGDIDVHSALQAPHLWHWAGCGGALGLGLAPWSPPPFAWPWHFAT